VVLLDTSTRAVRVVASDPSARIVTPTWRPDGRAIVAAADFDGDTFNLYEFSVDNTSAPRQLTRTSGGALWPDVTPKGDLIVFAGYTVDGFDVFTLPYPVESPVQGPGRGPAGARDNARQERAEPGHYVPRRYSPWSTLPPTSWSPI